jgi:two-component system cell cycle sensor histidine kinase PleC
MAGVSPNASASGSATARQLEEKLALEQLAFAVRNTGPSDFTMPGLAVVIAIMCSRWISWQWLVAWPCLVAVGCIPQWVVGRHFRRAPGDHTAVEWTRLYMGVFLVFGISWNLMPFMLWAPYDDLNHMLIIFLFAATLAGNTALASSSRALSIAGFVIYAPVLIVAPLLQGGLVYYGLAVLGLAYTAYMGHLAQQVYTTVRDMLMLRNDKNDLIVALGNAKADSDTARYRAEAASRAKSQFLANMSHELRTPLNAILGFSEIIASKTFASNLDKHVEYADLIHKSGHHLLALINDILDLAKIEAGALSLRETDLDVGQLIAEEVALMTPKTTAIGCELTTEVSPNLPLVFADERAMKQIILNLLSNAAKFTPAGGRITAFANIAAGASVSFGVSDTGVGIAPEDQARVFEDFGQGQHDIVTPEKSTGLGLPIVKGLVEAHGGRITLESTVGEGTRVTVFLPANRARPRVKSEAA